MSKQPRPKTRIPNSITEKEPEELRQDNTITREEFCKSTEWCPYKQEQESEEELIEYPIGEDGIPVIDEEKEYECPKCRESFDSRERFLEHWSQRHEEKCGAYGEYASKEVFDTWLKSKHTFRRHYNNLERYAEALKRLKKTASKED